MCNYWLHVVVTLVIKNCALLMQRFQIVLFQNTFVIFILSDQTLTKSSLSLSLLGTSSASGGASVSDSIIKLSMYKNIISL